MVRDLGETSVRPPSPNTDSPHRYTPLRQTRWRCPASAARPSFCSWPFLRPTAPPGSLALCPGSEVGYDRLLAPTSLLHTIRMSSLCSISALGGCHYAGHRPDLQTRLRPRPATTQRELSRGHSSASTPVSPLLSSSDFERPKADILGFCTPWGSTAKGKIESDYRIFVCKKLPVHCSCC